MCKRRRHRLVRHPELWPGGMATLRIVRDIEDYLARSTSKVKWLLWIHGDGRDTLFIVLTFDQHSVAHENVVHRTNRLRLAAHGHVHHAPAVGRVTNVVVAADVRHPPQRPVQLSGAVANSSWPIKCFTKRRLTESAAASGDNYGAKCIAIRNHGHQASSRQESTDRKNKPIHQ